MNRVTQRDLARLAGLSHTTISLALRGHPSIPATTRERVKKLARRHAYRPDPALAALNAYRVNRAAARFHGTLGWLTAFATARGWREMVQAEGYFLGAKARAEQLGYQLDEFWAADLAVTSRRLTQILLTRGVRGLIVAPLPQARGEITLEWKHFSSAALGYSLVRPQLHVVMNHQFRNMRHLVQELHRLRYRRIGCAMPATTDERADHNYLGGFWVAQQELGAEATRLTPWLAETFDEKGFRAWARKTRPDVVITSASWAHRVIAWLQLEGWHVPRDVGVAVASIPFGDGVISGIDENVRAVGAMAVDIVVGMIQRNETGLPATPWRMLAEGTWFQGRTVRRR